MRTPFERDRARVVHAAALRRLAAKTQVVGPQTDDFVRNRLTHSLEVAQVARDLPGRWAATPTSPRPRPWPTTSATRRSGTTASGCWPSSASGCGGFEGNAQTLRLLTRLEAKTFDADGRSVGLNLTRATLDACTKYPWPRAATRRRRPRRRLAAVVASSASTTTTCRSSTGCARARPGARQCVEAQVMDLADDVAYSVHDVEDGIVAGRIDLTRLDRAAVWDDGPRLVRPRRRPTPPSTRCSTELLAVGRWPTHAVRRQPAQPGRPEEPHQRPDRALLRRRPAGDVRGAAPGRSSATTPTWSCPSRPGWRSAVLKGIAAHYVMQADDRVARDGPPARADRRAGRATRGPRRPTRSSGRSPTTGTRPPTTPPGCASWSTRSRRSPTPARWPGTPAGPSGQVAARVGVVLVHQALVRQRVGGVVATADLRLGGLGQPTILSLTTGACALAASAAWWAFSWTVGLSLPSSRVADVLAALASLEVVQTLTAGVDNVRGTVPRGRRPCATAAASTTPPPPSWR